MDALIVTHTNMKINKNFLIRCSLYLCFISNTVDAVQHGFRFLYWVCAGSTAVVFITGIIEDIKAMRKK